VGTDETGGAGDQGCQRGVLKTPIVREPCGPIE
jgi:hypothetical protein